MTTITISERIRDFAAAVRIALDDLGPEVIDELTEGLDADLAEQAHDAGESFALGDPDDYANELRTAAGLPPRTARRSRASITDAVGHGGEQLVRRIRATGPGSAALDFLIALRPVWWVLRGWSLYLLAVGIFGGSHLQLLPRSLVMWVVLIAFVTSSIQWGRGRWLPRNWMRGIKIAASIIAILALPFQLGYGVNAVSNQFWQHQSYELPAGLWMGGQEVTNIFPYDAEGNPLSDVQLFTQDGRPLITVYDSGAEWAWYAPSPGGQDLVLIPNLRAVRDGWGVFPLGTVPYSERAGIFAVNPVDVIPAEAPFLVVRPLTPLEQDAEPDAEQNDNAEDADTPEGDFAP